MSRILAFVFIPAGVLAITYITGIRINITSSMPLGLYTFSSSTPKRGDIVAVCLPSTLAQEGLKRHYLIAGHCHASDGPTHSMAVLKKVIAVPDDKVSVDDTKLIVNGQVYTAPQQITDSNNLPITHFIHKNIYIHVRGYWLYGEGNPTCSWDSRYYGGIFPENIIGVYKPLWVLKKSDDVYGDTDSLSASPHQSPPNKIKSPVNSQLKTEFVSYLSQAQNFLTPHPQRLTSEVTGSGTGD